MGYAMARQEAVMASKMLLGVVKNPRLKDVPNEGTVFPPATANVGWPVSPAAG